MFDILKDKTILLTKGDIAVIEVNATMKVKSESGSVNSIGYTFQVGDVIRFKVVEKGRYDLVVLQREVVLESEATFADISLESSDTKSLEHINRPKDYWYEIELNPETHPQTLIGHDTDGPKIFRLFPEGCDDIEYTS